MNLQTQNFLELFRAFIHGGAPRLTEPDWEELYRLSKRHNLVPAICDAALPLPEFAAAPLKTRSKFTDALIAQSGAQLLRTEAFFSVYERFLAAGIRPLVLKGLVCRALYPKPELRISCDEDIWIPAELFRESDRVLQEAGFVPAVPCKHTDLLHVQALTYTGSLLTIELHINPFGAAGAVHRRMNRLFPDAFSDACAVEIEGHTVYTLNATDHYLFLFAHLYKHFLGSGVGIRQFADLLLFGQTWHKAIDFGRVHRAVAALGGTAFYRAVLKTGETFLGFRVRSSFPPEQLEPLIGDLMESGCFGNGTRAQQLSSACLAFRNRRRAVLFPSAPSLTPRYPFLRRFPQLLPAAWGMRLCRIAGELLFRDRSLLPAALRRSGRRFKLLRQYGA